MYNNTDEQLVIYIQNYMKSEKKCEYSITDILDKLESDSYVIDSGLSEIFDIPIYCQARRRYEQRLGYFAFSKEYITHLLNKYGSEYGIEQYLKSDTLYYKLEDNTINNSVNNSISSADEIQKYKNLLDSGTITKEEFEAKKKQLLGL